MNNKPAIAAMEALKKHVTEWRDQGMITSSRYEEGQALLAHIATLSNHVIIPEGEFAGDMAKIVEKMIYIVNGHGPFRIDAATEAWRIARKYAGEGK